MIRAAVLGYPVAHSLSPKLHAFWLRKYGLAGSYTTKEVRPTALKDALDLLAEEGYAGCNLTAPLKELALPMMDALDESALTAGAVNTVVIRDGKKTGYNSDGFGFLESLKAQCPATLFSSIVILGAGGAARGIVAALRHKKPQRLTLVNRTQRKAEEIISGLSLTNASATGWQSLTTALAEATLLVNCTSLGMTGNPPLTLDLAPLPSSAAVCDIVYRPLVTPLLAAAGQRGNPAAEGLSMLLHQGRLGFRHWFGTDPAVTPELYTAIKEFAK